MKLNEKEYKTISNYTGLCLVIFVVMINVTTVIATFSTGIFEPFIEYDWLYSVESVLSMIAYLSSFIVPAIILRAILKKKGVLQPLNLEYRTPKSSFLLIPATIAVTLCFAYINTWIMSFFGVSEAYNQMVGVSMQPYEPYQILLMFLSTALVPAICEEFLFRGTVLSNLLPFGQVTAITVSAVLFGLMHQNPYQIIYTTVAGFLIGYAYVKTRSIWCPTFIHFFNNAFSITEEVIIKNGDPEISGVIVLIMDIGIVFIGILCLSLYIIIEHRKKKKKYDGGSFGVILESSHKYEQKPIARGKKVRCFFSGGMIAFIVVAVLSMLLLLAMMIFMTFMSGTAI